jgi:hypothetical protein
MKIRHLIPTVCFVLSGSALFAQNNILKFQESFETDGLLDSPPRYTVENANASESNSRYFERRIIPSDGVTASGGSYDGDYIWGGRGINFGTVEELSSNEGRITFPEVDISDVGNVYFEIAVAEGGPEFEGNNIFFLEVSVDDGPWQVIGGFRSTGTNTSARYFEGNETTVVSEDDPRLTTTFSDWRWDLFESGQKLQSRIKIHVNAMAEQYYFDNIRIYGDSSVVNLNASLDAQTYDEPEAGGATPAVLSLSLGQPAQAGGQVVNLLLDDALRVGTDLPESVTIPEGQTQLQVPFNVVQDNRYSGPKKLVLPFSAEGLGREQVTFFVNNTTPQPNVLITEICAAPPGSLPTDLSGDINGDGIRDGVQDEFIEIVNFGSEPVDISGYTIADSLTIRHFFPEGTILKPLRSIVVFAGGNPVGVFGGAQVQTASQGNFGFNNTGDTITFAAGYGQVIESITYDATWSQEPQSSYHRGDTMETEFESHATLAGASGVFSPGTRPNGDTYATFANTLSIALSANEVAENGGTLTATVSLSSPAPAGGLLVDINSDGMRLQDDGSGMLVLGADEINLPVVELTIAEGETSGSFEVVPFNDNILDGDKLVKVVATSGDDILPALATLTVTDVEPNIFTFAINELLGEVVGTGLDTNLNGIPEEARDDQFIEVLNLGSYPVDMSGWSVHAGPLQDVSGNTLAHVFPSGTIVAAQGAIVILGGGSTVVDESGENEIPNANLVPANFGNAWVQTAMTASGSANPNGVNIPANAPEMAIELRNEHEFVITRLELTSGLTNQGTSVVLSPEGTGTPSLHFAVSSTFASMSPGKTSAETEFAGYNAGYFGLSRTFPTVEQVTPEGTLQAEPLGYMENVWFPYVYVYATGSYWYVWGNMDTFLFAYDFTAGQWFGLNSVFWPWAYAYGDGQWVSLED